MVPDYEHLPIGVDLGIRSKKVEERILDFQGRKLVTFRAKGQGKIKASYVKIPGFIENERYKIKSPNIPVSEVRLVKEEEKENVLLFVEREYEIPRECISCW